MRLTAPSLPLSLLNLSLPVSLSTFFSLFLSLFLFLSTYPYHALPLLSLSLPLPLFDCLSISLSLSYCLLLSITTDLFFSLPVSLWSFSIFHIFFFFMLLSRQLTPPLKHSIINLCSGGRPRLFLHPPMYNNLYFNILQPVFRSRLQLQPVFSYDPPYTSPSYLLTTRSSAINSLH